MANLIPLGVSKGDIVESGGNSYGSYVKWSDGTMMCWGTASFSGVAITTADSTLGGFYSASQDITMPQTFATIPTYIGTIYGSTSASSFNMANATSTTSVFSVRFRSGISQASLSPSINWTAIGKWK